MISRWTCWPRSSPPAPCSPGTVNDGRHGQATHPHRCVDAPSRRTDNPHEAEAFLLRAQQLVTQHSIDLAVARAAAAGRGRARPMPGMRRIEIGAKGTKGLATYVQLFVAIAHVNNVPWTPPTTRPG
ncbi:DUF2786 domain-containing protein [Nocardia nova]